MQIRKITEKERSTVVKLHQYAYGFWSDQEIKEDDMVPVIPDETFGMFEKGELVSVMSVLKLQQVIRGVLKGMGGISMVGSYPEARRQGYIRALTQAVYKDMKQHSLSVSMLEPFRETFYARLGYVPANHRLRLQAPLESLDAPSDSQLGKAWDFERCSAFEAKKAYVDFVTDFAPANIHGFALRPKLADIDWKRRNKDVLIVLVKRRGKVEALARYRIKGYMHFDEGSRMDVFEMYWRNLEAQGALFNFFGKHRDQITQIQMHIPFGTGFHRWFVDLSKEIEIRTWNPWMVRVIDAKKALLDLPAEYPGKITIKVSDPLCEWNNEGYTLQSKNESLIVESSKEDPNVQATIEGLTALVYGTHSIDALEYMGWLEISDNQAKHMLHQWFPIIPIYNSYNF